MTQAIREGAYLIADDIYKQLIKGGADIHELNLFWVSIWKKNGLGIFAEVPQKLAPVI